MPSVISSQSFDLVFEDFGNFYHHPNEFKIVRDWMVPKSLLCEPSEEVKSAFSKISQTDELINLYMNDVRSHFFQHANPILNDLITTVPFTDKEAFQLVSVLTDLKLHYYYPFQFILVPENSFLRFQVCYSSLLNSVLSPHVFQIIVTACLKDNDLCYPTNSMINAVEIFREIGKEAVLNQLILTHLLASVELQIRNKYQRKWNISVLADSKQWTQEVAIPAAHLLIPNCENDIASIIQNFSIEIIATLRTEELFDMVVDFPLSRPGLEDLKVWYDLDLINFTNLL